MTFANDLEIMQLVMLSIQEYSGNVIGTHIGIVIHTINIIIATMLVVLTIISEVNFDK